MTIHTLENGKCCMAMTSIGISYHKWIHKIIYQDALEYKTIMVLMTNVLFQLAYAKQRIFFLLFCDTGVTYCVHVRSALSAC